MHTDLPPTLSERDRHLRAMSEVTTGANGRPARRASSRSTPASAVRPTAEETSKRKPANGDAGARDREHVDIKPADATPAYKYLQTMTCQSLRKNGSEPEQCQSCIERRNDSGGCRFVDYRAFKLLNSYKEEIQTPEATEEESNQVQDVKRKRKIENGDGTKKRKLNNGNIHHGMPEGLDFQDYRLVGDRKEHGVDDKGPKCLFYTSSALGTYPRELSPTDAYIMSKIAPSLSKAIKRELEHESQVNHPDLTHPIMRIAEDPKERSLCDACATTLFMVSYICFVCGREYCIDCYEDWDDGAENVRFDMCSRNRIHKKEQMIMAVRACENETKTLSDEFDRFLGNAGAGSKKEVPERAFETRTLSDDLFAPVYEFSADSFDEEDFKYIWGLHGRPIIIKDCLDRFKLQWSPEYFINKHGEEDCTLIQTCPPFERYKDTVGNFFEAFGKVHDIEALKLKDWPPNADFAEIFPDLMGDFENALPDAIAKHVKRDGIYNLASRFPKDYNKPDLGPKMYNAFPATTQADGKIGGTTNLHRDITDAINFMMYATSATDKDLNPEDRSPGAIWDIFPIGASKHIREYLDSQYPNEPTDPFHRQNCYLTIEDLENLDKDHAVKSYRIFQRPGDAIMIPAGCAHQVRNIKDCIKVAVDFLSPENVEVGEYLIQENRNVSERAAKNSFSKKGKDAKKMSRVKKEDVLQMWKCLVYYYAGIREELWGVEDDGDVATTDDKGEDLSRVESREESQIDVEDEERDDIISPKLATEG
ncbi:hypothetical protein ABW19_dt0203847 [Dactylella cylindrospora]|nr:hypothetical protein ABW19_dt0203847 [Dactylella cylindrospora]